MRLSLNTAPTIVLLAAPMLVALAEMGFVAALVLVLAVLLWRWILVVRALAHRPAGPEMRLESISASHFVEKVRWCLDRLGIDYQEVPDVGALGVFLTGRTVPRLVVRTGSVSSSIGNSADILRYLWGRYGQSAAGQADFLRPTPEAVALEGRLDRYGVDLQRWIYYHILPHRQVTLSAWGADDPRLPVWQRTVAKVSYPVLRLLMRRAFHLSDAVHERVVERIESLLGELEGMLGDGRRFILGGDSPSFADFAFAALSGLWIQPQAYAAGQADPLRLKDALDIPALAAEVQRWRSLFPRVTEHVERLYREERSARPATGPGSSMPEPT